MFNEASQLNLRIGKILSSNEVVSENYLLHRSPQLVYHDKGWLILQFSHM